MLLNCYKMIYEVGVLPPNPFDIRKYLCYTFNKSKIAYCYEYKFTI